MFLNTIHQASSPFYFSSAIEAAASFIPEERRRSAFRYAGRGVQILESDEGLNNYLVAYGEMHVAKIRHFLPSIPFSGIHELNIVDWGCGQGLAAAVVLEYLREHHPTLFIRSIRLIEISSAARRRAQEIILRYENAHDVQVCNWDLQFLQEKGFELNKNIPTLHLFSNILDIIGGSNKLLSTLISTRFNECNNYLLCVGPKNCGIHHIRSFYAFFETSQLLTANDRPVTVNGCYYRYNTCSCYGVSFIYSAIPTTAHDVAALPKVCYYPDDLLIYAAADMKQELLDVIKYGVNIDFNDENGNTAILLAAKYGAIDALNALINSGVNINKANTKGATPLYFAAKYGETECVRVLIQAGAELEKHPYNSGLTPFLVTAKYGNQEAVDLLIEAGCNRLACDSRGRNAEILSTLFSERN
jgi:hypothetical protein